ncbi:uncharacterized protein LOC127153584 [Labeo rohita]|uniref:uncharacterized protein LOC127153584 n=1 Tax=Labeo rohita TaxID=84645 RepID=UPI0021E2747B|nr:uncharacterized protein LOC127153584 [Labeo rohita]
MDVSILLLCLFLQIVDGVFDDDDIDKEIKKKLSVMEGDSVTLRTGVNEIERDVHIIWTFESQNAHIADIYSSVNAIPSYVNNEIFRDRLQVNFTTGSLTIRNIRITDNGTYRLDIVDPNHTSGLTSRATKTVFSVIVYARLPIPIIKDTNCSLSSEGTFMSKCVLLCSVENVSDVTLSWYEESLLSSISAFNFSTSLSLPLEVDYQDKNIYSCVINNTISKRYTHLENFVICPASPLPFYLLALIPVFLVVGIIIYWIYRKQTQGGCCCCKHQVL